MSKIKNFFSDTYAAEWILLLSLVLSGGFNEYVGCVLSAIISVLLIVKIAQNRNLVVNINITSLSIAVITLLYLISCFYAIDSGMAFVGFLKFLPVLLYMLLLMQDKGIKEHLIALLPYVALALGVLSLVLVFLFLQQEIILRFPTDWRDFFSIQIPLHCFCLWASLLH